MKKLLLSLVLLLPMCVMAQRMVKACGEVDYVVPESQSQAEAKRIALARARTQAIADEFGTVVHQTTTTAMHTTSESSNVDFNSFSENEVRGIWIEDTREPEISMSYRDNLLVIHASVCGKIRELKQNKTELSIRVLNDGKTDEGIETTHFRNNDRISVAFQSPIKGYVALFIREENTGLVHIMMPYDTENADGYAREVKSNREYVFLNSQDPQYPYSTPTILTTDRSIENNTLIVVFSEQSFRLSLTHKGEFVPEVEDAKFRKWLHGLRVHDTTAQVEEIVLTIKK